MPYTTSFHFRLQCSHLLLGIVGIFITSSVSPYGTQRGRALEIQIALAAVHSSVRTYEPINIHVSAQSRCLRTCVLERLNKWTHFKECAETVKSHASYL